MEKCGYVYILTNKRHTVLYVGATSNLNGRIWQHKEKLVDGFTKRYHIDQLVYYERCETIAGAIAREKQIKGGSRARKLLLIKEMNPLWRDLTDDLQL